LLLLNNIILHRRRQLPKNKASLSIFTRSPNLNPMKRDMQTQVRDRFAHVALCLALVFGLLALTACDRQSTDPAQPPPRRHVLSAVYPLADVVRQVAGDRVQVEWLCEYGNDPRDLKLSDEQKRLVRNSDVIVTSGFGDYWAAETLDIRQQELRLVRPDLTPTASKLSADEHDRGALWLDPQIAKEVADTVRERLVVLDGTHDQELRTAVAAFQKSVDDLDAEFRPKLAPLQGRKFLSLRPTWVRLAAHYGLVEIAPTNTDARGLSDDDVRTLKRVARTEGTDVLAIDASLLPGVQRQLQQRTGLRLLLLDPLGSSAPEGRSTWIKIMRYNLEQLERGLK
jgi:ABC-type Zn uptake system ZnuABC Zn-binding protein ZnuA